MTDSSSHGAASRTPVVHGGRRVPGLHQRTLKDGTVIFEARLRIDGKDKRVRLDAKTKFDAVREYEGLRVDRHRGHVQENRLVNPTVAEAVEEWLEHVASRVGIADENRRYAEETFTHYRSVSGKHLVPFLGRKHIADVNVADLRRFVAHLQAKKLAPKTAAMAVGVTSSLFNFAVKNGYADRNPCKDLARDDRPSHRRSSEPRYLSASEIELLLAHSNDELRPIYATLAYAALRVSEARGLHWRDVDFDTDTISVRGQLGRLSSKIVPPKTRASAADVPMFPVLKRELLAHRRRQAQKGLPFIHPDQLVFTYRIGQVVGYSRLIDTIRHIGDEIGLNPVGVPRVTCHDLRHSCIGIAFEKGASIVEIAELARHASPAVTLQVYAGLTKDGRGQAVKKMLASGFGT